MCHQICKYSREWPTPGYNPVYQMAAFLCVRKGELALISKSDTRKGSGWQTSPSYFLAPKQLSKAAEVGGGQQQGSFRCHHCSSCAQGQHPPLQGSVRAPSCPEPGRERQRGGRRNQGRRLSLWAHSKENQKGLQKREVKGASEKKSQGMSQPVSKFWSKLKKVFSWLHWVFMQHTGFL